MPPKSRSSYGRLSASLWSDRLVPGRGRTVRENPDAFAVWPNGFPTVKFNRRFRDLRDLPRPLFCADLQTAKKHKQAFSGTLGSCPLRSCMSGRHTRVGCGHPDSCFRCVFVAFQLAVLAGRRMRRGAGSRGPGTQKLLQERRSRCPAATTRFCSALSIAPALRAIDRLREGGITAGVLVSEQSCRDGSPTLRRLVARPPA